MRRASALLAGQAALGAVWPGQFPVRWARCLCRGVTAVVRIAVEGRRKGRGNEDQGPECGGRIALEMEEVVEFELGRAREGQFCIVRRGGNNHHQVKHR